MMEIGVVSERVTGFLQTIERPDADAFTALFTPGGELYCGSRPVVRGRPALRTFLREWWLPLESVNHRLRHEWSLGDTLFAEGDVTFELKSGRRLNIPFCYRLGFDNGHVRELRMYLDLTPLAPYCGSDAVSGSGSGGSGIHRRGSQPTTVRMESGGLLDDTPARRTADSPNPNDNPTEKPLLGD